MQRARDGLLARDRVIYRPDRPGQGWIIHRVSRSGDTLTVDGTSLKGLAKRRICVPPLITGGAYNQFGYDLFTGDAGERLPALRRQQPDRPGGRGAGDSAPCAVIRTCTGGRSCPWQARFEKLRRPV